MAFVATFFPVVAEEGARGGYFCARKAHEICARVAQKGEEGYLVGRQWELAREFLKEHSVPVRNKRKPEH
jgi:hypothetical protein